MPERPSALLHSIGERNSRKHAHFSGSGSMRMTTSPGAAAMFSLCMAPLMNARMISAVTLPVTLPTCRQRTFLVSSACSCSISSELVVAATGVTAGAAVAFWPSAPTSHIARRFRLAAPGAAAVLPPSRSRRSRGELRERLRERERPGLLRFSFFSFFSILRSRLSSLPSRLGLLPLRSRSRLSILSMRRGGAGGGPIPIILQPSIAKRF